MKIFFNKYYLLMLLLLLIIFKNNILNIMAYLNFASTENINNVEISLLKEKVQYLENELNDIDRLNTINKYNYSLSKKSYQASFDSKNFFILGGEDRGYNLNAAVINETGVIGIITKIYKNKSRVTLLPYINNLSVEVSNQYGTLKHVSGNTYKIKNIEQLEKININDNVYTSEYGAIDSKLLIGSVVKKDRENVYVKTNVDLQNINYVYVVGFK